MRLTDEAEEGRLLIEKVEQSRMALRANELRDPAQALSVLQMQICFMPGNKLDVRLLRRRWLGIQRKLRQADLLAADQPDAVLTGDAHGKKSVPPVEHVLDALASVVAGGDVGEEKLYRLPLSRRELELKPHVALGDVQVAHARNHSASRATRESFIGAGCSPVLKRCAID